MAARHTEVFGIFALFSALLACGGTKSWSERPVQVPTRTLAVDEARLFASEHVCSPELALELDSACEKRCGPIVVWRGSERVATLLAPPSAAPPPVPEEMRPAYTTPGKDANRSSVHIPISPEGDRFRIESSCGAELAAKTSGVTAKGSEIAIDAPRASACDITSAEVVCQ